MLNTTFLKRTEKNILDNHLEMNQVYSMMQGPAKFNMDTITILK